MSDNASPRFEWDENKRLSNIEKHGIDFQRVRAMFDGRPVTHLPSTYPGEQRSLSVGRLDDVFVTVVWTRRDKNIRVISARRSRKQEITLHLLEHG